MATEPITSRQIVKLVVNGKERRAEISANETLAEVLREKLGMTGTKIGCDNGECGACTVLIDGQSILSCLTLAIECHGRAISTIEGLSDANSGELHLIQEAFVENGGFQCAFCTPGMIMSAKALLDKNLDPTEEEIREAINGNLCRCACYQSIIESISTAARKMRE